MADAKRLRERYATELDATRHYLLAEDCTDEEERARVRRMRAAILFIESNRELPLLSWPGEIIDSLIAAEQAMLVFRQRHARMVERVIGRRVGTGGSAGVDYLDRTALSYRVFKEIWAARTLLLDPDRAPQIQNRDFYGLRTEPGTNGQLLAADSHPFVPGSVLLVQQPHRLFHITPGANEQRYPMV
ncbi:MAG: tryptophan 2,3-dioxygenase family protein [Planctomycetota bacterium]|jgi:tryptophan 2,3-dioxygenase